MITADRVMMRDGATRLDQRVAGRILDRLPLLQKRTVAAEGVERKVRRGPVRIDMGEAACDLASHAGRLEDRTLRRRFHLVVNIAPIASLIGSFGRYPSTTDSCTAANSTIVRPTLEVNPVGASLSLTDRLALPG